jgi:phosphatidylinositol-3-phosphatase
LPAAAAVSLLMSRAGLAIVRPDHVVVVIQEDRASNAIGDANMPYFNQLASTGLWYANSHGVTRPSQPNYLALFSGSTQFVEDNFPGYDYYAFNNNLAKLLNSSPGKSFVGYAESLPEAGSQVHYATDLSVDPHGHPDV